MQDERIREDAKQLLRVAYERQVAVGDVGLGVDLLAAAEHRGLGHDSAHLAALVDFMEVTGWIEPDPGADAIERGGVGCPSGGSPGAARRFCGKSRARWLPRSDRPQHEVPYLHIRAPRRVGVGGEGDRPVAKIYANKAGLLALREQVDRALAAEEGMAAEDRYRETDEAEYDLWIMRAASRKQMGGPREPEGPDRSMFA